MQAFLQNRYGEGDSIMLKLFDFKYEPVDFDHDNDDEDDSSPVPGYEEVILNWLEELASSTSQDELRELEEVSD
jgi:hypothetical protein